MSGTFGDINTSLVLAAGESLRRNAGDTAFEAYTPGAGGGAPVDAQYLTLATDATLTVERVLTLAARLSGSDAGAGSTYTVDLAASGVSAATYNSPTRTAVDTYGRITSVTKVFSILQCFYASAPTGYVLLQGGTIGDGSSGGTARANADTVDLFTHLWDNLADAQAPVSGGRGASAAADFAAHKTITLPDMRQRFPIGKAASGTGATLGGTGGAIDHTHSVPALSVPALSVPALSVPAHYHGMGTGADLNITASGSHTHSIDTYTGVSSGSSFINKRATTNDSTQNTASATHTHASGDFSGRIGLVTGGVNGNSAMTTGTGSTGTGSTGTGTTGSNNAPFLAVNFMINL